MFYKTFYPSLIGNLTLGSDGDNLVGLWIEGQKYYGGAIAGRMNDKDNIPVFSEAKRWMDRYFSGEKPLISELPLAPVGSAFRQEVWNILCEIPYGTVTTYGDIAKKVALRMGRKSMSSQAVGGAVGHNPISIVVPCHRVVGSNGSLTGYAAGVETKLKLLELEGVDLSNLFLPKKGTAV